MRRFFRILRNILLGLLLLAAVFFVAIRQPAVQTWLAQRVAAWLSGELGTEVSIGRVEVDLWARLVMSDLLIQDQQQDTLLSVDHIRLGTYSLDRENGIVRIGDAELERPVFHLRRFAADSTLNMQFLTDYIASLGDSTDTTGTEVYLSHVRIIDGEVRFDNERREPRTEFGIDWNHLGIDGLNVELSGLAAIGDSVHAQLDHLSFRESTGFLLQDFSGEITSIPGEIRLANARINTNESAIHGDLAFRFDSPDDLNSFEEKVRMNHSLRDSHLQLGDLAWFVPELKGLDKTIGLSGDFRGRVANLRGKDIEIVLDEHSWFRGDIHLDGLPDMDQTFITLDIDELVTNKEELERIPLPPFDSLHFVQLPANFAELGTIRFSGNFTGFTNDFVAYGSLLTQIGRVNSDIALRWDEGKKDYVYKGKLSTERFDLGRFYSDATLGPLSSDLEVEGTGLNLDRIDAAFKGSISELFLNDYTYTNIKADGTFRQRFFNGFFQVDDPNVVMDFTGQVDFTGPDPLLSFQSDIYHLDLKAIKVLPEFSYSSVSGSLTVDSKGFELEKFEGDILLEDLTYCSMERDYYLSHLALSAVRKGELEIILDADFARGELKGDFDLREIGASFSEILSDVLPSYQPDVRTHRTQNFTLDLEILDFTDISGIFLPELSISPGTRVRVNIDEPRSFFEVTISGDSLQYAGNRLSGFTVDARRPDEFIYLTLAADTMAIGSDMRFQSFALDARSDKDTVYTDIVWGTESSVHSGDVKGVMTLRGSENFDFRFNPSSVTVNDQRWSFRPGGSIVLDSSRVAFHHFGMQQGSQGFSVEGVVSKDPEDELDIEINGFDLANLNPFIGDDPKLEGIVTGSSSLRNVYKELISVNDLAVLNFTLNDYLVGDLCVESTWDNALRRLRIDGELEKDSLVPLSFAGYYRPDNTKSPIDLIATVRDLDLAFINAFLDEEVLKLSGYASTTLSITGTPEAPQLEGDALLRKAGVFVNYLNCTYTVEQSVGIYPDMFTFDHIRIRDQEGNPGFLTGQIMHDNFGDWNFDVMIDIESPMLAMNTTEELNPLYYGKAYATGNVNIYGYEDQLEFDINVRSERGTKVAMPMNSTEDQGFGTFVRFIDADAVAVEEELDLAGIRLNMQLEITDDAEFQVIFDEAVGDVMKGRGRGHISMEINNLSTFNMYGTVAISQGDYLFTLKNLLNKEFTVYPGGTISWFGDPFAGELNLDAVYKVTASLYDIMPDATQASGQRVPVDLVMHLTGRMFNPGVSFDIRLPTVDEVVRSRVASVISTEQERNRQAFSLLVMRRFVTPPNITRDFSSSNAVLENSTELLSSQISNWLSQISDDFNLGFNYRPGDDISNEEIALALSTQLFNERLSISGNFGVSRGNESNQNPTNYIGDIRIEYKITREGKIRLVVYNESNDFRMVTTQQSPYTQGVGVVYQEDFDTWDQFICGFRQLFVPADKRQDCL